jgi:hypothetical protein
VVVVTFTHPRNLRGYRARFAEPLTVTTDPQRLAYRAFGFGRGRWWRVWGVRAARRWVAVLRGDGPARSDVRGALGEARHDDTLQLGGNVVVDATGRVAWWYRGDGPDARPSLDELVAVVRRARTLGDLPPTHGAWPRRPRPHPPLLK